MVVERPIAPERDRPRVARRRRFCGTVPGMQTPTEDPGTPAPIVAVTVHRNGALVRRRFETQARIVLVRGLPLLFAAESLRVRPERGRVADLREACTLVAAPSPPPAETDARAALQAAAARLDDEDRTIAVRIQLLEKLAPVPPATPGGGPRTRLPDAPGWGRLAEWVRTQLVALDAARADVQVRRRALARERTELDRRARPESAPPRFFRAVRFELLDVDDPDTPVGVELEYFVEAARWFPAWRLELEGTSARLHLEALVAQATGEDWTGARLTFDTADLRRETTLPELRSWRLGPAQPPPRPAFRPLPPGLDALFAGYDLSRRPVGPPAPPPFAMPVGAPLPAPPPAPPRPAADEDSEASVELGLHEDTAVAPPPASPVRTRSAAKAAPPPRAAPAGPPPGAPMPAAPMARSSIPEVSLDGAALGGGGPEASAAEPPGLPPRLRYPWLRLAGPDEPHRGTLQPMDPFTHLFSLVEGTSPPSPDQLRRAIEALRQAARLVHDGPAPAGVRPLAQCHFHASFGSPAVQSVPGDGQYHRLHVVAETAPARLEFRAVPRESPDVWRYCVLAAGAESPRPAGPLTVYRDGQFLVTSTLDPAAMGAGGALVLNLGVEPDLRVTERHVTLHQEDKGLMGQVTRVSHRIRVKVRSTRPGPSTLLIFDRLPVPADARQEKDIGVELVDSRPAPVRTDRGPDGEPLAGGLTWTLELPPGEHVAVEHTYRVTLPARFELDGGNRREN